MGWTKGRGLGANEDGAQEFVRVRFKNDAEGLGYENRDDQWTVHEEGFNGLLKVLNGGNDDDDKTNEVNGNSSGSEEETRPMGFGFKAEPMEEIKPKSLKENLSGVSLEEKSMYSKARVHYKKFTRGKDLAQYSEKDLANIFGKKATEDNAFPVHVPDPIEQPEEEEKPVNPNFGGVQTVSTGLSVNDYFRLKMEAMKSKFNNQATTMPNRDEEQEVSVTEGSAKKKKKKSKQADENVTELEEPTEEPTQVSSVPAAHNLRQNSILELV